MTTNTILRSGLVALPLIALSTGLAACQPRARVTMAGGPVNINQATAERYDGPKARVAVSRFQDKTAKGWWSGQIGDGMADMLATSLVNTGRFIALERRQLSDVIAEQDFGASGRVRKRTAAPIGQVEGAEILVTGVVTEFEPNAGGASAGGLLQALPYGNVLGPIVASIRKAHIAIDIRAVDTRSSRIVFATSVEGEATDVAGLGALGGPIAGIGGFARTPMEKAIRVAINEAVQAMVAQTPTEYYRVAADDASPTRTASRRRRR